MGKKPLRQIHEIVEGGIRPIKLAHGEFGVMLGRGALVAKTPVDFKNLFKAADDQALEVEFRGDTQVKLHIQSVVVGCKGLGRGAARNGVKHGGFHFEKALAFHEPPQRCNNLDALEKNLPGARGKNQIQIPLPVAGFHILQAVVSGLDRADRAGQQGYGRTLQGQFPGVGAKKRSGHPDHVADIHLFKSGISLLAENIARGIALQCARGIHDIEKSHFAKGAVKHDPPGQGEALFRGSQGLGISIGETGSNLAGVIAPHKAVGKELYAAIQKITGFSHLALDDLIEFLALGKALKQGHEISGLGRLSGKFYGLAPGFGMLLSVNVFKHLVETRIGAVVGSVHGKTPLRGRICQREGRRIHRNPRYSDRK